MAPSPRARLSIDLDALAHNYHVIAAEAAGAETAPVVKADGYGLGAAPIARRLWTEGARTFFVARLEEGEALRAALSPRAARILVLDGFTAGSGPRMAAAGLTPVLNSLDQVAAASRFAIAAAVSLPCALQVDTGMNRQGLGLAQASALAQSDRLTGLEIELVMSHLGSGAVPEHERNRHQLAAFARVRALFPRAKASLAASAGAFLGPDYRFDLVRPGISLFGGGPQERPDSRLRAVARLEAPILDIRHVAAGELIGYGATISAERATRVALVGAGYADGVIRATRRGGTAWAAGALRRLYIVDMDLTVVDLGEAEMQPGDMVELLGPHALLDDQARAAGSIAHECLVRLSSRAERIYLGADAKPPA
ncbi:MAG: alanine racemase [Phenylobacterium sp.]|nr:alanine racemase [Phenylobacterium sp.]